MNDIPTLKQSIKFKIMSAQMKSPTLPNITAKINDMRVTIRKLQAHTDEMNDLSLELLTRELEDQLDDVSNSNDLVSQLYLMLREKVIEFSSIDEKQHKSLIDKQQQLIDLTNEKAELEVELNKINYRFTMFYKKNLELEKLCQKILSPETDDLAQTKDDICRHLYYGLTYQDLMEKPKEERKEYWSI